MVLVCTAACQYGKAWGFIQFGRVWGDFGGLLFFFFPGSMLVQIENVNVEEKELILQKSHIPGERYSVAWRGRASSSHYYIDQKTTKRRQEKHLESVLSWDAWGDSSLNQFTLSCSKGNVSVADSSRTKCYKGLFFQVSVCILWILIFQKMLASTDLSYASVPVFAGGVGYSSVVFARLASSSVGFEVWGWCGNVTLSGASLFSH